MKKTFSINLEENLIEDLDKIAKDEKRSRSQVIEIILEKNVPDIKSGEKFLC